MKNEKRSRWFGVLLLALALAIGYGLVSLRTHQILERSKTERFLTNELESAKAFGLLLKPGDIEGLRSRALSGDVAACLKLSDHYFGIGDLTNEMLFNTIAAEKGDSTAAFNLGQRYSDDERVKDKNKAVYWYKKAAEKGDEMASKRLEELGK